MFHFACTCLTGFSFTTKLSTPVRFSVYTFCENAQLPSRSQKKFISLFLHETYHPWSCFNTRPSKSFRAGFTSCFKFAKVTQILSLNLFHHTFLIRLFLACPGFLLESRSWNGWNVDSTSFDHALHFSEWYHSNLNELESEAAWTPNCRYALSAGALRTETNKTMHPGACSLASKHDTAFDVQKLSVMTDVEKNIISEKSKIKWRHRGQI